MAAVTSKLSLSLSKNPTFSLLPKTLQKSNFLPPLSKPQKTNLVVSSKNPISDYFNTDGQSPNFDDGNDESGVVGIYGDPDAARFCKIALHALQHRGQEGVGIVSVKDKVLHTITGVGLVSEVLDESKLKELPGESAIGHVRYSTAGASMLKNAQPFVAGYRFGSVSVAHNGNFVNSASLRAMLQAKGSIF